MSSERWSKLNSLQRDLPHGLLVPTAWFKKKGYSDQLLKKYKTAGWVEAPARGIYRRPGGLLKWQHLVGSLSKLLDPPPHIGGITAFEEQGRAHFVPLGKNRPVHLYGETPLPSWARALPGLPPIVFHRDTLFGHGQRAGLDVLRWGESDWELPISMLERAYLELLDEASSGSLEHERLLLEGLHTLRPGVLTALLEDCRSIKVKRLFLALAARQNHKWFPLLDLTRVTLGSGKRVFARQGKLDRKYLITLPQDVDDRY